LLESLIGGEQNKEGMNEQTWELCF